MGFEDHNASDPSVVHCKQGTHCPNPGYSLDNWSIFCAKGLLLRQTLGACSPQIPSTGPVELGFMVWELLQKFRQPAASVHL